MLQHMVEAQIFNLVLRGMDLLVGIGKVGFDNEGGSVPVFACGGVVGAGVAAFREDVGNIAVLNRIHTGLVSVTRPI